MDQVYGRFGHVAPHDHVQHANGQTRHVQPIVTDEHAEYIHVQYADVVHEYEQRAQSGPQAIVADLAHVHGTVYGRTTGPQPAQEPGRHQRRFSFDVQQHNPTDQVRYHGKEAGQFSTVFVCYDSPKKRAQYGTEHAPATGPRDRVVRQNLVQRSQLRRSEYGRHRGRPSRVNAKRKRDEVR